METYNKCKVIILPTDKSNLFIKTRNCFGKLIDKILEWSENETYIKNIHLINSGNAASNDQSKYNFYHLYILSEEEIKEGDWLLYDNNWILQATQQKIYVNSNYIYHTPIKNGGACYSLPEMCKKIIASTDPSLNLPQIPQSFISLYIEEYNAGRKIEKVEVEYEKDKSNLCDCYYTKFCKSTELPKGIKCRDQEYFKLKINPDNTISIKPLKNSWNFEELKFIATRFRHHCDLKGITTNNDTCNEFDNWIKQNL